MLIQFSLILLLLIDIVNSYFYFATLSFVLGKVHVSKKATKIGEIFTVDLTLCSKGAFTNYVYKIWLFLTTYPPPFTFSMV